MDLDPKKNPQHVAMIMDGNGRWALRQKLHRLEGHHRGSQTVEEIVSCCHELGIRYLTLFAFSQENWNRPSHEVDGLMDLLYHFLILNREKLTRSQIRLRTIGEIDRLPPAIFQLLEEIKNQTQDFTQMTLILALSYGGRNEIARAADRLLQNRLKNRDHTPLRPEEFSTYLDTEGIPDPDLLIRTSGENRLSNFLLWQMAYAELYFTDTLWPDFNREEFLRALAEYQRRERRFGRTSDQLRDLD